VDGKCSLVDEAELGEERREAERNAEQLERVEPDLDEEASRLAEEEERNAWQEDGVIDRILLFLLLASVAAAVFAALTYAAGRRFTPPRTPSMAVAVLALLAEVLVAYRIVQEPEVDSITEVTIGPPLAIVCLAAMSFGAFRASRAEEEPVPEDPPAAEEDPATTAAGDARAEAS
jgi:hypothetical protein